MAYVYMVRCEDDSLYTGIAKDLGHRMNEHYYKKKNGAKYTKSRQIQTLEMVWEMEDWSLAAKIEYRIKRLDRQHKLKLLQQPERLDEYISLEGIQSEKYQPHPDWKLEMFVDQRNPGAGSNGR